MLPGNPFDMPPAWSDPPTRERRIFEPPPDDGPTFALNGWRRLAAIGFASAPAIVFAILVLLHALSQSRT